MSNLASATLALTQIQKKAEEELITKSTPTRNAYETKRELGKEFQTQRRKKFYAIWETARKAGLSSRTVIRIEKTGHASIQSISKLATALDCSITLTPIQN